jgi:hypothetical protein
MSTTSETVTYKLARGAEKICCIGVCRFGGCLKSPIQSSCVDLTGLDIYVHGKYGSNIIKNVINHNAEMNKILKLVLSLFHKCLCYAPAWCQFMIGRTDLLRLTHGELTHVEHCGSSLIQGKYSEPS